MILNAWDGYSLRLTLYPSFTLSLLKNVGNNYVKNLGLCNGLELSEHLKGVKIRYSCCDLDYVRELCGLTEDPLSLIGHVDPKFHDLYYYLSAQWRGVGLSTASKDFDYIFVAVFLSKRTSYHKNVLYWMDRLFRLVSNVDDILNIDVSEIIKSPQIKELNAVLANYTSNVRPHIVKGNVGAARHTLLEIKGVGPKVTYAYLLHAMRLTDIAPADTHLTYFTSNVLGLNGHQPDKKLCLKYGCEICTYECIVGSLRRFFGKTLGYMQTITYVHVKTLCKKGRCHNCILRRYKLCNLHA